MSTVLASIRQRLDLAAVHCCPCSSDLEQQPQFTLGRRAQVLGEQLVLYTNAPAFKFTADTYPQR